MDNTTKVPTVTNGALPDKVVETMVNQFLAQDGETAYLLAHEGYLKCGRGFLRVNVTEAPDRTYYELGSVNYCTFPSPSPNDPLGKAVLSYDPEREVVLVVGITDSSWARIVTWDHAEHLTMNAQLNRFK